jgi:hypothetical protein
MASWPISLFSSIPVALLVRRFRFLVSLIGKVVPVRDWQFQHVAFKLTTSESDKPCEPARADGSDIFRPDDAYDIVDETSQEPFPAGDCRSSAARR